ncbi:MAG: uroporphyrinogen-III synthase [Allosphingosinicella sp.]
MRKLLVLRPEPGAAETAARARAMGLEPIVASLFTVRALDWEAPDPGQLDAILLTSAHAARLAGRTLGLPSYAVGEATAEAARRAGYVVTVGPRDGAAALALARSDGRERILHLCGREHIAWPGIDRRIVYAAEAADALPASAREGLAEGAVALLHSPRAATLFGSLVSDRAAVPIVAISRAAADAAGPGWACVAVAPEPRDAALLEVAAKLCNTAPPSGSEAGR